MKCSFISYCLPALRALAVLGVLCLPVVAQNDSAISTQRTPDGHPDLSGYYNNGLTGIASTEKSADGSIDFVLGAKSKPGAPKAPAAPPVLPLQSAPPSYKPEYAAKVKAIAASEYQHTNRLDPQLSCLPMGIPRVMSGAFQIVQTPGQVVILYESLTGPAFRIIPTDGRPHPKDIDPSFLGSSVGHWDGDTLVVDVIGLSDQTWLGPTEILEPPGYNPRVEIQPSGWIHSDEEHVIERYSRKGDILTYDATVEDPVMFTKPWVINPRHFKIGDANDGLEELICVDNDKDHVVDQNNKN